MIGHLGSRVSALLDGQLDAVEEERAWEHVHQCPTCRDAVEREGWVKTRLLGLSLDPSPRDLPAELRASLLHAPEIAGRSPYATAGHPPLRGEDYLLLAGRPRRHGGFVAAGGTAVGAAVLGVLALGVAPAEAPVSDRRAPTTSLVRHLDMMQGPRQTLQVEQTGSTRNSLIGVTRDSE